jgi:hypothetical protein
MKNNMMDKDALLNELAAIPRCEFAKKLATRNTGHLCLHCRFRLRGESRRKSYCLAQPSKLTANGYKLIVAHDESCGLFQMRMSKSWQNS